MSILVFSRGIYLSKNTSSYPITLADVKQYSKYFIDNPTETSFDSQIENVKIPMTVYNWENITRFYLLDQLRLTYLDTDNLLFKIFTCFEYGIPLMALNVREVDFVKYLEHLEMTETTLSALDYFFTTEVQRTSIAFNLKKNVKEFLDLYPTQNNFKTQYKAGYLNNDFSAMPSDIKMALAMVTAVNFDVERGYCDGGYSEFYNEIFAQYTVKCHG